MQQTAIDFFVSKMYDRFGIRNVADMADEIAQARDLFRQQIEEAYYDGMGNGVTFKYVESSDYFTKKYGQQTPATGSGR